MCKIVGKIELKAKNIVSARKSFAKLSGHTIASSVKTFSFHFHSHMCATYTAINLFELFS